MFMGLPFPGISLNYQIASSFCGNNNSRVRGGNIHQILECIIHQGPVPVLIARWFMGTTWGPSGADRTQVGPMLAPWTLLSRWLYLKPPTCRSSREFIAVPLMWYNKSIRCPMSHIAVFAVLNSESMAIWLAEEIISVLNIGRVYADP